MNTTLTRYALPVGTVMAGIAYAALLISSPLTASTADVTEPVTEPVERSTVEVTSPDAPLDLPVIEVTADAPVETDCFQVLTLPDDGTDQWADCWMWFIETSETEEEQAEAEQLIEQGVIPAPSEPVTEPVERLTLPDVTLTNCASDGPSDKEAPCYWDASENGNGQGHDFILWTDGQVLTPSN